jgi:hypothetical protein
LSQTEGFWAHFNKLAMENIHSELVKLNFPETVPASMFSKHIGASRTSHAASLFGYSKFNNPHNMSGIWPKIGFIYKKDSDGPGLISDEQQIAEVQSRKDKWLIAILQGLNFPDEVHSSDIMIDGKVLHINKVLPAMSRQGYEIHKHPNKKDPRFKVKGELVYVYRKQTTCFSNPTEA